VRLSGLIPVIGVEKSCKVPQPELDPAERIKSFDEVDLVVTEELMKAESERCLRCGTLCYFNDEQKQRHLHGKAVEERLDELLNESPR
jgi:hypothetical protein